ncbi:MAG: spore protease YyaC [Firmicutes bacterium]|nr:spore protease YyaC [Bacillota bacterium]
MRVHIDDPFSAIRLSDSLQRHLQRLDQERARSVVAVCIGTDRSTGDSLGPLVGSKLNRMRLPYLSRVAGTLDKPVHATNLKQTLEEIAGEFESPLILAVDACLGRLESVGFITLAPGALQPGAGVNKTLPPVGDLHISGIVNVGGYLEFMVLQNTRLSLVMRMADRIALGIYVACKKLGAVNLEARELPAYPVESGWEPVPSPA